MPATEDTTTPPSSANTSEALLLAGLALFFLGAVLCVRRRQVQTRAAQTRRSQPYTTQRKPLYHVVPIADAVGEPTWRDIQASRGSFVRPMTKYTVLQPLAVQTPLRQPSQLKDGSRWSSIKGRPSVVVSSPFLSDASLHTATLLDGVQMSTADAQLQIAVLIAMPLPPAGSRDGATDANIAVGVARTRFPAP